MLRLKQLIHRVVMVVLVSGVAIQAAAAEEEVLSDRMVQWSGSELESVVMSNEQALQQMLAKKNEHTLQRVLMNQKNLSMERMLGDTQEHREIETGNRQGSPFVEKEEIYSHEKLSSIEPDQGC